MRKEQPTQVTARTMHHAQAQENARECVPGEASAHMPVPQWEAQLPRHLPSLPSLSTTQVACRSQPPKVTVQVHSTTEGA